ncbi:MAG TPA: RNA 2',3'-cyclic phosphodiesterase [Stellaceae bacterium]|nr:RNA 2',3'-cyclic phosphodiesterase [Stellaceae bacterium]
MLRLFVAIGLPPELKLAVSTLCGGLPGARWVDAGNYHITLRFIGEVDEGMASDIDTVLARIGTPRFAVTLAGIGSFSGRELWVGVEKNATLLQLRDKVERALIRVGLEPEGRRYTPHVTLARLKRADDKLYAFLREHALYRAAPFPIARFSLVASYRTKTGSLYEDQADYRLTG